ncbi:MAG: polysaccharide biosynthesis protein [Elusimicrobiaceae bacterium]|nr:polysaccharide biosynthesis protein [Elusimicrobiaceae bacterium]
MVKYTYILWDLSYGMKKKSKRSKFRLARWKIITLYLMVYDTLAINAAYFAALLLRFDLQYSAIPQSYLHNYLCFAPIYTVFCLIVFFKSKLYQSIWQYASVTEASRVVVACAIATLFQIVGITLLFGRMPISYYIFGSLFQFALIATARFIERFINSERSKRSVARSALDTAPAVLLIGAGDAGRLILQDMQRTKVAKNGRVRAIIDDNPRKWGRSISGVPVVGGRDEILAAVKKYNINKIYFAIPTASAETKRDILNICKETQCKIKVLPGIYQLVNDEISVQSLKDVSVEDLLGREPIKMDMTDVFNFIAGKTILVTGGGGSIGSELCRQIAAHQPKLLLIFDMYENNAYDIEQELKRKYPKLNLKAIIGSVRDSKRIARVFEMYKPEVVYHAAAHKHVPLMEGSPCEAVKNNAIGTYKTAYAAMKNGCQRFVLISTDKAVNPTNIMGATKRLCEMIVQTFDYMIKNNREQELPLLHAHMRDELAFMEKKAQEIHSQTEFVAVRFGNVLGSNGSVIPLFKRQMAEGGPLTVTHPDVIRYFMTIPEAVSLVLKASVMGKGSEIFVLDMGSPVKIDTLARNLIKLSGLRPDVDIKITYTGLRPGEKLYEEKLMAEEGLTRTENNLIHIGHPISFDNDTFLKDVKVLMNASYAEQEDTIRTMVAKVVTTYHPAAQAVKK